MRTTIFPCGLLWKGPWAFIEEPLTIWQQGAAGSWSDKALQRRDTPQGVRDQDAQEDTRANWKSDGTGD